MILHEEVAQEVKSPSLLSKYNLKWAKAKMRETDALFSKMPLLACVVKNIDLSSGMDPW
jgi:hypothetical protein